MDPKVRHTLTRAGITLAAAAVIVTVALWFNAPSTARVEFEAACRSLIVPAALKLNLNEHFAQLASATVFGFDATLNRVSAVEESGTATPLALKHPTVTLAASDGTPPSYLALTPEGALGTATLEIQAGTTLTALPNGVLRIDAPGALPVHIVVQSDAVTLDGERYLLPGAEGAASVAWRATGEVPGLFADLRSRTGAPSSRADLAFAPAAPEIALLDAPDGVRFSSTLRLSGTIEPVLSTDGRTLANADGRALDLSFEPGPGTITAVGLILSPPSDAEPRLRVAGWIDTDSVRHGRTELLPTWIEETLDTSNLGRSAWITALGVLAIVLFKAVDGALNAVIKLWFTE